MLEPERGCGPERLSAVDPGSRVESLDAGVERVFLVQDRRVDVFEGSTGRLVGRIEPTRGED
jgi:hypothetical protein